MGTHCFKSEYKGIASIVLENDKIRATWLPSYGSKLASLIVKKQSSEHELLFQSDLDTLKIPIYGSVFSDYDSSGFDECFPTIDACEIDNKTMPDHGEVWAMPWLHQPDPYGSITFSVYSKKFNYTLSKKVMLNEGCLESKYHVEHHGGKAPLPFIWTPHALFNASASTRFIMPEYMDEIYNVCDGHGRLGQYGSLSGYPVPANQSNLDLSYLEPKQANNCEKYYFVEKLRADSQFGFYDECSGTESIEVIMEVDHHTVPYLGVWKNQGAYKGHYNFAIEPCTGIYDNTAEAMLNKKCQVVEPNCSVEWTFNIDIRF